MNRRDAIKALVALPEVARIATAPVRPSDIIVVECDDDISQDVEERIKSTVSNVWPNQKIVVCDKRTRIKIIEGT